MRNLIKRMVKEAMEDMSPPQEQPLEGQQLLDALSQDISDMFKDINGIRPRWIDFGNMSLEELEQLHDQTSEAHGDWWNQERVEQDLDDMADEDDAIAAADAEEEMMRTPEDGEEFPKQTGMRRRVNESKMRRNTANKLYNLLIMEQEYGIITPQELAELKSAINKVLGVEVGNLL
jgi:hypothetical protein